ncbi:MAG: 4Fe-4S dicluster domain-containing protein [Carbonactinosporaceae bacterium]
MRYGFAIDHRTCIGCHACTVACKTEHEIPVGQFRTWVKYVDKGEYPATTREFGVMRCNHCTDAPCIDICPTTSLFRREDGIVDFDGERCIGCKSCMQACPYDAIYIDEATHTAAKCNFCAHRIDSGLEPACVVVCPTQSIWVGDLDDQDSGISRLVADHPVSVRAPEQRTGPNVFYLGADHAVLDPLAAPVDDTYLWAQPDPQRLATAHDGYGEDATRTTLNTAHPRPWGWRVTTYLWAKGLGAGALALVALGLILGYDLGVLGRLVAPALALAGTAATGALLVWDLKRPARFLYLFLKPNPRSWLVWGGAILAAYAGLAALWLVFGDGSVLRWPAIPLAALTAGYTAFLFGQAEGRDLWQSPLLFWHLLAQAGMVGAGGLLTAAPFIGADPRATAYLVTAFVACTAAHLLFLALEYGLPRHGRHATKAAAAAVHIVVRGRYAATFWAGGVLAAAAAGLALSGPAGAAAAGLLAQVALLAYESVFVRAGQDVPLS